jgi:hypothetical protein
MTSSMRAMSRPIPSMYAAWTIGHWLVSSKNASIALLAPGRQTWKRTPAGMTPPSRRP